MEGETQRPDGNDSDLVWLRVFEKNPKYQLRLRLNDSKKVQDLKYKWNGAVAEQRLAKSTVDCLWQKLLSVLSDINKYRQRLPLCTERLTIDVTDDHSGFL